MPAFDACLLDYGNTIVEFDSGQIEFILERLAERVSESIAPLDREVLREAVSHAHLVPYVGDPPSFREPAPEEQMGWVLERSYGAKVELDPDQIAYANRALQDLFVESISIQVDVVEALARMRRAVRVGLVSNYPCGRTLRRSLEKEGIRELLDPIVVSGDVGFVKPHPEPFDAALRALAVRPENVLFVGDRWDMDMLGARKLGMKTCHITGFTSDGDWEERYAVYRPDYVVGTLAELEGVLAP